jgi:hypothetical protein
MPVTRDDAAAVVAGVLRSHKSWRVVALRRSRHSARARVCVDEGDARPRQVGAEPSRPTLGPFQAKRELTRPRSGERNFSPVRSRRGSVSDDGIPPGRNEDVSSPDRPHFERLDEPNRWALANREFLVLVWSKFVEAGDWPNGRLLQRELFSEGEQFDLDEFSLGMPPMFGRVDPLSGKIHLTPRGLSFVPAAQPVLESMADLVRIAVKRYADPTGDPMISSAEFEGLLGIDPARARLLAYILLEDHWLFRAAGGTVNEGQRFQVDDRAVLRVRDVQTIDRYLDAQAASWYPDTPAMTDHELPRASSLAPAASVDRASGRRRPSWWKRHRTDVGVIATVAGAIAVVAGILVSTSGGGTSAGHQGPHSSGPGSSASSSVPKISNQTGLRSRWETADARPGIVVYANNRGTTSHASDIPIGKRVRVVCRAPNYSGITTINAFYLIATPPWRGLFASANEFANGAPVGVRTNVDPIDSSVSACRSG